MNDLKRHKHKVKSTRTVGYSHPVGPPEYQDRRAHGAVCHIETCACGAEKKTNSNGRFQETTGWTHAEDPTAD